MNRVIEFRGKRSDKLHNNWVYGLLIIEPDDSHWIDHYPNGKRSTVQVTPETVGQYTGFTDAGKAKLFEDDVIENDGVLLHISFCDDTGAWYATEIYGDKDGFQLCEFAHSKETWLQGNVHENPDLLIEK